MTGPGPAVSTVRVAVHRALADVEPGSLVLVACSGGADSLALAAATAFEAARSGLRAGAVTVDHGLQDGSTARAAEVVAVCRRLGLDPAEARAVTIDPRAPGGPEARARRARYAALDHAASQLGAGVVLLGHTLDDQAETVLLGLARGSGARSLSGMAPVAGHYRRPLLGLSRAVTRAACAAEGLVPWEDPHNVDAGFARVRVRRDVLPVMEASLGPGVADALARSARLLRDDADALDAWAEIVLGACRTEAGGVDAETLSGSPPAVRRRVLRRVASAAGVPGGSLSAAHLEALDALVARWHGQGPVALPGGVTAFRRCGTLLVGRDRAATTPTKGHRVDENDLGSDLQKVLVTEEQIQDRIRELAAEVDRDYAGRDLLIVGVLKGAVMVMADLSRALHSHVEMDWMAVSSYGSGTQSSGVVRILKDLDTDISGRHVLVVEDIIDSGLTLSWLLANLGSRSPASVEVLTLLRKPEAARVAIDVRYVGFDITNEFVVGYGLDYAEKYRNIPFVGTLAPHVYRT